MSPGEHAREPVSIFMSKFIWFRGWLDCRVAVHNDGCGFGADGFVICLPVHLDADHLEFELVEQAIGQKSAHEHDHPCMWPN